jgi:hypothetical protein
MANKQDSNATGLRWCEEASLKTLPGSPIWTQFEPNSYGEFGGSIATVARKPITTSRQRKKGVPTDLDASGSFNQDLTMENTAKVLQGFFFADAREKKTTQPMTGAASIAITGVTAADDRYAAASGMDTFKVGSIALASGFTNTANNGIRNITSINAAYVGVSEALIDEGAPPAAAKLETVGFKCAVATVAVTMNGNLARLTQTAGTDWTTLGLIEGEWIYVGGDAAGSQFVNNQGFARIAKNGITAAYLEFDKTTWEPQAEAAAGITLQVFFGTVIKNEATAKRRTYQLERVVGTDGDGTMSEYLVGAVPNEFALTVPRADKVTADLSFMALDHEPRTGLQGVKAGARPTLPVGSAINTTNDVVRIKLSLVSTTDSNVTPLFAFAEELNLSINNNVTPDKAIGVMGGFDTTAGMFEVGGNMTVYFADNVSVSAVRNNSDVTLDMIFMEANRGMLMDIPLLSLGDGRLNIEPDQSIKLPLETNAAESAFGHTLLFMTFPYLPSAAG